MSILFVDPTEESCERGICPTSDALFCFLLESTPWDCHICRSVWMVDWGSMGRQSGLAVPLVVFGYWKALLPTFDAAALHASFLIVSEPTAS